MLNPNQTTSLKTTNRSSDGVPDCSKGGANPGRSSGLEGVGENSVQTSDDTFSFAHKTRARVFSERTREVLEIAYNMPRLVGLSYEMQVYRHLLGDRDDEMGYFRRAKEFVCFFKATYYGEMVKSTFRPMGAFGRWIKSRLRVHNTANDSLMETMFKFKAAGLPLSGDVAYNALWEMRDGYEKIGDGSFDCHEPFFNAVLPVLDHVRRELTRKMASYSIDQVPNFKGTLNMSGADGGAFADLVSRKLAHDPSSCPGFEAPRVLVPRGEGVARRAIPFDPFGERDRDEVFLRPGEPVKLVDLREWIPKVTDVPLTEAWRVTAESSAVIDPVYKFLEEEPTIYFEYHSHLSNGQYTPKPVISVLKDYPQSRKDWQQFVIDEAYLYKFNNPRPVVKASSVIEPLKIRTITKGEASVTAAIRPVQQMLVDILGDLPCFTSMKRPYDATDIERMAENYFLSAEDASAPVLSRKPLGFDSSDYSNASGGTDLALQRSIFRYIVQDIDPVISELIMYDLRPHEIRFSTFPRPAIPPVIQRAGTLMGCITSFIALQLINLAAHLLALKESGDDRHWKKQILGVLINGDDRVTRCTHDFSDKFWAVAKRCGLNKSPGKSTWDENAANINSQLYRYSNGWAVRNEVFPSGLYFGQKKIAGHQFDPKSVITEIMKNTRANAKRNILKKYLSRWGDTITATAGGRNLFIPNSLGGWGQVAPLGWKIRVTQEQKTLAAVMKAATPFTTRDFGPTWPSPTEEGSVRMPWIKKNDTEFGEWDAEIDSLMMRRKYKGIFKYLTLHNCEYVKVRLNCHLCDVPPSDDRNCACCGEPPTYKLIEKLMLPSLSKSECLNSGRARLTTVAHGGFVQEDEEVSGLLPALAKFMHAVDQLAGKSLPRKLEIH